jgi:anti-anti-sigma regulatory factor
MERAEHGDRAIYVVDGAFDRASAWALRERVERETAAEEVLLDFTRVREFSDLGVAVLAHGLTGATRRVVFRGLRQHELRIFRYCGVAVEELAAEPPARAGAAEMTA